MTLQIRRDTAANWTTANPTLAAGQPGYETDTGRIKIGNGATAWTSLAYRFETGGGGVSDGDKGDITVSGAGTVWTVDNNVVTNAKAADMATATIKGRATAGTGDPEDLTASQVRTILGLATIATSGSASDLGAGTLPAARFDDTAHGSRAGGALHANVVAAGAAGFMTGADKTKLDAISGTNTGDVTLAGTPNYLTIVGQAITRALIDLASHVTGKLPFANIADMANGTLFYRKTAGAGAPETQTLATLKTDLGLTGTNSGDQTSIVGITGTKAQFDTAVSDGNIQYVGDAPTAHTHLLAAGATDVTVTAANLNILDDGLNTALHFHDADRARGNHTGTQLAATISDFSTAADARIGAASINALADVIITAASTGQVIKFNGTNWINDVDATGGGGVSDGDKGDITVSSAGAVWTVDAAAITLAKMADVATGTLFYRKTAAAGPPEVQTLATLKTDLGLTGTNSGDQTSIVGLTGTKAQFDTAVTDGNILYVGDVTSNANHTGEVTGATALTIADNAVINARLADMATQTFKGRTTAATGDPEDLTVTQATAMLNLFSSTLKGLVPASGGGTTTYLRADGTWVAPAGGGDVVGPASSVDNAITRFDTATGKLIQNSGVLLTDLGEITLPQVSSPATPATDTVNVFGRKYGGRMMLGVKDPSAIAVAPLMAQIGKRAVAIFHAIGATTTVTKLGYEEAITGTNTAVGCSTTNIHTRIRRIERLVTAASTTAIASQRTGTGQFSVGGDAAGLGGFFMTTRWGPATGVATTTHRAFCGMGNIGAPTDVEPSTLLTLCGMGWDAADTNIQFMHNDGAGACTKIDLGASFPVPTVDRTSFYEIAMFSPPGTTQSVSYEITNLATGAVATGTVTTNLPTTTNLLGHTCWMSVGGTSSVIGIAISNVYIETDF